MSKIKETTTMATVKVNTSDTTWIESYGLDLPVTIGPDARGVMYFNTTVEVPAVEHVKFAGASMIRFDLGADAPRDHSRWAMYPASYLVQPASIAPTQERHLQGSPQTFSERSE